MKTLTPIKYKKAYDDIIIKKITQYFYDEIFKPCIELLKDNTVINANDILLNAIRSGLIYYQDGAFYSSRGRFSNSVSLELEKIGAKYSKYRKAYLIDVKKVPVELLGSIEMLNANTLGHIIAVKEFLNSFIAKTNLEGIKLNFDVAVNQIMLDLQDRTYKNFQNHKIQTISPKINDFRANYIAKNYTDNLNFWIKDWTEQEIPKMREVVGQMALEGKNLKTIAEYIKTQFKVSSRKAKFLARNESAIATSSYLQSKYIEAGFTHYKWVTSHDERVRLLHKDLNGNIYRFDDPPIIYDYTYKTGVKKGQRVIQRGNPGETYNCLTGDMQILSPFLNFRIYRRKFAGEMSSIVLPMGTIKITANHPILTDRGWICAKNIQVGDKVAKISNKRFLASSTDPNNTETRIDEFFSFYEMLFNSERVGHTNLDFHGDISIDNQVDIINIESKLRDYIKADFSKFDFENILAEADKFGIRNTSDSSFFKSFPIGRLVSNSDIRLMSNAFSFFFSKKFHSVEHSFRPIAWINSLLDKSIGYNTSTNAKFFCELFNTHTISIKLYQFIVWDLFNSMIDKFHIQQFSSIDKCFAFNSEHFGKFRHGHSFGIEFDTVQDKFISVFSGHIYNLENANNWYYTENYITKNCRCTIAPIVNKEFWENRKK